MTFVGIFTHFIKKMQYIVLSKSLRSKNGRFIIYFGFLENICVQKWSFYYVIGMKVLCMIGRSQNIKIELKARKHKHIVILFTRVTNRGRI